MDFGLGTEDAGDMVLYPCHWSRIHPDFERDWMSNQGARQRQIDTCSSTRDYPGLQKLHAKGIDFSKFDAAALPDRAKDVTGIEQDAKRGFAEAGAKKKSLMKEVGKLKTEALRHDHQEELSRLDAVLERTSSLVREANTGLAQIVDTKPDGRNLGMQRNLESAYTGEEIAAMKTGSAKSEALKKVKAKAIARRAGVTLTGVRELNKNIKDEQAPFYRLFAARDDADELRDEAARAQGLKVRAETVPPSIEARLTERRKLLAECTEQESNAWKRESARRDRINKLLASLKEETENDDDNIEYEALGIKKEILTEQVREGEHELREAQSALRPAVVACDTFRTAAEGSEREVRADFDGAASAVAGRIAPWVQKQSHCAQLSVSWSTVLYEEKEKQLESRKGQLAEIDRKLAGLAEMMDQDGVADSVLEQHALLVDERKKCLMEVEAAESELAEVAKSLEEGRGAWDELKALSRFGCHIKDSEVIEGRAGETFERFNALFPSARPSTALALPSPAAPGGTVALPGGDQGALGELIAKALQEQQAVNDDRMRAERRMWQSQMEEVVKMAASALGAQNQQDEPY